MRPIEREYPIEREDIEEKLREIRGQIDPAAQQAKTAALATGIAIAGGLIVVAYLIGRRRGRKPQTVVEIRRA